MAKCQILCSVTIYAYNSDKCGFLGPFVVPALDYSSIPTALPDDCPDEILCTEEDVFALLSTLDCSKASGAG